MRTLNARTMSDLEREWLADVKRTQCVFCNHPAPGEAHHPLGCQGLHFHAAAVCKRCHETRAWLYAGMTEREATNETIRRVTAMRAGKHVAQDAKPIRIRKRGGDLSSSKCLPRKY